MPDLNELRRLVSAQRARSSDAARAHAIEEQRLRALRQDVRDLQRRFDARSPAHRDRQDELRGRIADSETRASELREARLSSRAELDRLNALLEPVTDPRRAIAALDAGYPILLFPVRLETRFVAGSIANGPQKQLLVRVYPDDCLVDGFEPDLSESEVKNLRRYWCSVWAAGGDEGLERAAWRELCAAHGAGRAMYLAQHKPLAGSDPLPARGGPNDVILVVPVDAPIASVVERDAIGDFWTAAWRAGRDEPAIAAAFNALRAVVGTARADEVRRSAVPFNVKDRPQAGVDRATVPASTVFVVLPSVAAAAVRRQAWTRAPEAALLPERFVLIADSGTEHIERLGPLITQPLAVGPDPLAAPAEQFSAAGGELLVPAPLKWMTDFDAALDAGMAFRIDLTPRQAERGFDRLYVLGVRLTADHERGRQELEELIQHQARSQSGFAVLPQGTPTNNSEEGASGWGRVQEADELFDVARLAQAGLDQFDAAATAPYAKRDGLVLAEALGIDAGVLQDIPNADGTDQAEARAMNAALWPATLGYWMDTQMRPAFDAAAIGLTRRHFIDRVTGRGAIPAVRIGKQPYGILPTCAFSRMRWMEEQDAVVLTRIGTPHRRFLRTLRDLLRTLAREFWDGFARNAPRVGRRSGNPQQQLLDILGLHPSSVEFHLHVADSAERIWNGARFFVKGRAAFEAQMRNQMRAGVELLNVLGYSGPQPEIIEKFYSHVHGPMNRPAIDTPPLSETGELTVCTDDGKNYLQWCREKAETAFDDLRLQKGFSAGKTPDALLYHMLRHALQLGYHGAAVELHEQSGLLTAAALNEVYREPAFVHIAAATVDRATESRYGLLYAKQTAITGTPQKTVAEFIPAWMAGAGGASTLADQVDALRVLEHASTAALDRAFAEHIDLCSYRWDAWMLSLVNERLHQLRRPDGDSGPRRLGLHLGAFGWVEGLVPDPATLPPAALSADLTDVFMKPGQPPLHRDPANAGHVLTPSLNHAVTAAVLRNGYASNAVPASPGLLAVDLSSARVRVALQFIEGVRNGQPLGALLGYQFERRLHDRHGEAEMDRFIYQVRKAFPLAAKRIADTVEGGAENAAIEHVEARNVCDGVLLLEHVRTNPIKTYPWGKALDSAGPTEQAIIDQEVAALFEIHDAIADVAIAESVHQVTMGNTERAAAAMDAVSRNAFPPEPDVVTTPRSGISLTHRVGLHLPVEATAPAGATPRAQAEPAIDRWLESVFPPLTDIVVRVTTKNSPPASVTSVTDVSMQTLGLRPIDLLHLLDPDSEQAMSELDDRIARHVVATQGLCPDASVLIRYTAPVAGKLTAFEVAPLAGSLRALVMGARALKPSDAALPNEAVAAADSAVVVPAGQVTAARNSVVQLRADAATLLTALDPLIAPAALFSAVVAAVDAHIASFIDVQQEAGLCGVALAGAGGAMKARREWFELVRANAEKLRARWQGKLATCDDRLAEAVDPLNSNLMQIQALEQAEREISTAYTVPLPPVPAPYLAIVLAKRTTFTTAIAQVESVKTSAAVSINALWTAWSATFPGRGAIDLTVENTVQEEEQVRLLVRDMHRQIGGLIGELDKRITRADDLMAEASGAGGEQKALLLVDAAKALLGDGLRIVPRFALSADQADEWQNAFDGRAGLLTHLSPSHDFPVDDWLYGVARVRAKMHDFEKVIQLAGAFGTPEPVLAPVQFPFHAGDPWLALELPAAWDMTKAGDRLLYTASYPGDDFDKTAPEFGGLLLDEWTEVIPGLQETAGLAFHYDRPGNEPPQTMLLVTPAGATAQWTWEDLRDAVPDTFDLAAKRTAEPRDISTTPLARLLPATLMAFTTHAISISSELRTADLVFAKVPDA